jgi:hypothetical protein
MPSAFRCLRPPLPSRPLGGMKCSLDYNGGLATSPRFYCGTAATCAPPAHGVGGGEEEEEEEEGTCIRI